MTVAVDVDGLFRAAAERARAGDPAGAESRYRRVLDALPDHAPALVNLGLALLHQDRVDEAAAALHRATALRPDMAAAHNNLGTVLLRLGRHGHAADAYRRALALAPDLAPAHYGLGVALQAHGDIDAALGCYERAAARDPRHFDTQLNRGFCLARRGRPEEALRAYRMAEAVRPDSTDLAVNIGNALAALGAHEAAADRFEAALARDAANAAAHFGLGQIRLLRGRFREGWAGYEWRRRLPREQGVRLGRSERPAWDGAPLDGRTVLLQAEQGLGDTIQFARYAPLVRAKGGRVVLETHGVLKRLFATLEGVDALVDTREPLPPHDLHAALPSLPGLFGTDIDTVPATVPYLAAPAAAVERWRARLAPLPGLRVGVVWAGNPGHGRDRARSVDPALLGPLLRTPGVSFVGVQPDRPAGVLAAAAGVPVLDAGPDLGDVADTAALLAALDLVVTVDTSVAHLAGALGRPVWVLVADPPDWRWMLGREDTPWYPTMRLFRQSAVGDWRAVLARMAGELAAFATDRDPPATCAARAAALVREGRAEAAVALLRRRVERGPRTPAAHTDLGIALGRLGRMEEAATQYRFAALLAPRRAGSAYNHGTALQALDRLEAAEAAYRSALAFDPGYAPAWHNLGNTLRGLGRVEAAVDCCRRALALDPDHAGARHNLGIALLMLGRFAEGWSAYESWRRLPRWAGALRRIDAPLWDGGPLDGRSVLLHAEQGMGDTIQFARFVHTVAARGGRVVLECPRPLLRLFGSLGGVVGGVVDRLVPAGAALPPFDVHAPIPSLPAILGADPTALPAGPYLRADPALVAGWRRRLAGSAAPRVGLVWAGNPAHGNDRARSIPLATLAALLQVAGASFHALQLGPARDARRTVPAARHVADLADGLGDYADTAAALEALDLVVTVDTSVAHLAGALGREAWVLLPFEPDWRWLLRRDDSPWYPSLRLFRQPVRGDWPAVVETVAAALAARVARFVTS